jgi:hypothetical protein
MSGMNAEEQDASIIVTEVLAGTPADVAGIKSGDKIVQWLGAAKDLVGSDTPGLIGFSVVSHGVRRDVKIRPVPLSELWHSPVKNVPRRKSSLASGG